MGLVFPHFSGVALLDSVLPNREERSMGRRGYPPEFRRKVLDLVEAGRPIAEVAQALGISDQSIYTWRRQDRIDRDLEPGLSSAEKTELAVAKRRIAELETELRAMHRAMELVREVVPPKAVRGGRGDGRRRDPGRGGLPGPGRVDLGLLRLAVPPAIGAGHPPCLVDRPDRRGPPGFSWHLRRPAGPRRATVGPWDRGRPQRHRPANAPRRAGRRQRPAQWRHAKPDQIAADLVDRNFARTGPNQLWVTDITEHPTREGKLYCAVVLDAYSRRVVGWSIDATPTAALVTNALGMAIQTRTPPAGAIIHSDQGVQFASWAFTQRAKDSGLVPSMGSVGDCYDNAMIEAFWSRMQVELLDRHRWKTRVELANAIFEYLEIFHNRQRRHSSLGMRTPLQFENRSTVA
jgi:putative transposase